MPSRSRGRWYSTRGEPPAETTGGSRHAYVGVRRQPLISSHAARPRGVVLARHVGTAVEALRRRRLPVRELVVVVGVARVIRRAVVLGVWSASHAFKFAGASPNHSATCAWTSGFVIQLSPHVRAVRVLRSCEWTIQLSDHAVDPSFGRIASTGGEALSACTNLVDHLPRRAEHRCCPA